MNVPYKNMLLFTIVWPYEVIFQNMSFLEFCQFCANLFKQASLFLGKKMLKKLGSLRNNFQKLVIKKKLKEKRDQLGSALQKATLSLTEVNSLVKELQESVESTLQLMDTYPSPDLIEASSQSLSMDSSNADERDPLLQEVSKESALYLLENAKQEITSASSLLQNLLQIQKVVIEQEKIIRKEKELVFKLHEQALALEEANRQASQSWEAVEISTKSIQSVLPAARHHQHQIQSSLAQAKKHLEQMINIQPENRLTGSERAKNASQAVENAITEINTTVEDAHKIIKETKEAISEIRHEITMTEAAQKLIDAEIELENANTLLKNLAEVQRTIVNEGIKIKTEKETLLQQYPEGQSLVKDLNAYKGVKLAAESIQTILPSAQQYWQQIRIVIVQAKLYIKEAKELQQKHTEEVARARENQRNSERVAIVEASQVAEKSIDEINNAIEEARKSLNETTHLMTAIRYKANSTAAAQRLMIAEEELASANALLQNLQQSQNNIVSEKEKIRAEKTLYDSALTSDSDTDLSAHSANVKLAVENIQAIISLAEQQWQRIKITIAQAKSCIQEATDLQQAYEEEQILKEEERRHNERVIAQRSLQSAENVFSEVNEMVRETNLFIEEAKGKITTAAQQNPNLQELTQKLISAEGDVASVNILLRDILHTREAIIQEKDEIKSGILLLNNSSTGISAKEELDICKKINCTAQTLQSLLPPAREHWQKIKSLMSQCKDHIAIAEKLQENYDAQEIKRVEEEKARSEKSPFEVFIQPQLEAEIEEIKLRIQQQEEKVEQLLNELQELEFPLEEDVESV